MPAFLGGIATHPRDTRPDRATLLHPSVEMPAFLGGIATYHFYKLFEPFQNLHIKIS